jgi:PAS domain S-box-containing protein
MAQIALSANAIANLSEGVLISEGADWPSSRIVFVNDAACHLTGYMPEELIGKRRRVLRGNWKDRSTLEQIRTALSAGRTYRGEIVNYRKDGSSYHAEISITPLLDTNGGCINFVSIHRDITDRKKTEQALSEREERLQAILNTVEDSIIIIDRRGIIVSANPATHRIFGYSPEELIGHSVNILMPSPYREEHDSFISRYIKTGKANILGTTREVNAMRRDGSTFPTELTVNEIEHLGLFTGIHRDISTRKHVEREMDQYRKDLKAMASELLLAEEEQRQELARDLHDGLGQSLFRLRRKLDQALKEQPAAREINEILVEIGKMVNTLTFELSPPVLHELGLRPALRWLAMNMKERFGLTVKLSDDGQAIRVDERAARVLFRSIRELLINVVKHSETNLAYMSIRTGESSLQIKIRDKGKGFDPKTQVRHVGTGHFGLFSIRERLEYIGGAMRIESEPDEGTTLTLTLPCTCEAAKAATN